MLPQRLEFNHWTEAYRDWRWKYFSPRELRCRHCDSLVVDIAALDALTAAREAYAAPVTIYSAYRCPLHPIEAAKPNGPGPHSVGAAFDTGAASLHAWIKAVWAIGRPLGFGFGKSDDKLRLHFDWDTTRGPRVWGY